MQTTILTRTKMDYIVFLIVGSLREMNLTRRLLYQKPNMLPSKSKKKMRCYILAMLLNLLVIQVLESGFLENKNTLEKKYVQIKEESLI